MEKAFSSRPIGIPNFNGSPTSTSRARAHLSLAGRKVGRRRLGPERQRATHRLHPERKRREHAAYHRRGDAHGNMTARPQPDPVFDPRSPPRSLPTEWQPARSKDLLAFNVASARSPSDVYTWSTDAPKNIRPAGRPVRQAGFPPIGLSSRARPLEIFRWARITGFLYEPDAQKFPGPRPVIIKFTAARIAVAPRIFGTNNYFINELGCAIIFPTCAARPATGKRSSCWITDLNAKIPTRIFRRCSIGCGTAARCRRVMVYGGSYGGFMTLEVATNYADRIRCAIDIVGISNLATFLKNTESYRRDLRRVEYGDERDPKMADFMERIAPLNNAAEDYEAAVCRGRRERSARAEIGSGADRGDAQETKDAGLVHARQGRRPRFCQEEERRFSVLRDGAIHSRLFAEIRVARRRVSRRASRPRFSRLPPGRSRPYRRRSW